LEDVIDLTAEGLAEGVRRITAGKGADIVIESIGGTVTGGALSSLGLGGVLITLGYSAGRKTTIDLTDLIWKRARMAGFSLFAQSPTAIAAAWRVFLPLIVGGSLTSSPASRQEIPTALCMSNLTNSRLGGFLFH
jgi:NADPH:quinone reductase